MTAWFYVGPELFFWESCSFKVYPFDTKCDCHVFTYYADVFHDDYIFEAKEIFNIDIFDGLTNPMRKFRMIEREINYL